MDIVPEKRCGKCGDVKATSEFHRDKQQKDGFRPHCKTCRSVYTAGKIERYRVENGKKPFSEKVCSDCKLLKSSSEFNKDKSKKSGLQSECKACYAAYRATDEQKARIAVYGAFWRNENAEKARDYQADYYSRNVGHIRVRQKVHYVENAERIRAEHRAYYFANPEAALARWRNRDARKIAAGGTHTAEDVDRQFNAQKGKCWWCGCKLKKSGKGKFHADHREPLAKGGSNGAENIVCACPSCNLSKNAKTPLEFAGRLF